MSSAEQSPLPLDVAKILGFADEFLQPLKPRVTSQQQPMRVSGSTAEVLLQRKIKARKNRQITTEA